MGKAQAPSSLYCRLSVKGSVIFNFALRKSCTCLFFDPEFVGIWGMSEWAGIGNRATWRANLQDTRAWPVPLVDTRLSVSN